MIENKVFKKEMRKINKMTDNNIMMQFRDLPSFNIKLEPSLFCTTTKEEVENLMDKDCNNTYYEWIDYNSKVKPYYDVDAFYEDEDEYFDKREEIWRKAKEGLKKLYPEGKIAISSSCGRKTNIKTKNKKKITTKGFAISYHLVVNGYETDPQTLEKFNEDCNVKSFIEGYDKSVYSDGQNFRLLYSYKPNDKRQKKPMNYHVPEPLTHIIQSNELTNQSYHALPKSPSITPPQSPKKIQTEEDEIPFEEPVIKKKIVEIGVLKEMLDVLNDEELYEYDTWVKIGLAIFNITDGTTLGKALYIEWSETDENGADLDTIATNWEYWTKTKDKTKNKIGYTFIKDLYNKYKPTKHSTLQQIFYRHIDPNNAKNVKDAIDKMLKELNNRLIFVKSTGDFIILDKKQMVRENGDVVMKDCWFLKTTNKVKDHFAKENFIHHYDDDEMKIKPFDLWMEWDDRREVSEIGFDPKNQCKDVFNLWNGFAVSKEKADTFDESDADPILQHIKELWANNDEEVYDYILNLFAHYIQKPHKKTGVLLALKSKQGGGKGIILDKLAKIIGDEHYIQNSNADYLFGNFNGQLEGKIVCNLDEAFWGGDKKKEGVVKNKITETRQTINKKNKEAYKVDDYVNYIITTNNDWFAGVSEDDRRHYCIELNNKLSGRMTEETCAEVQPVLDAPCEAFAKVLYNRNIENFRPRVFKKTPLLQNQVEMGWTSVKTWYNMVMRDGGFIYNRKGEQKFVEWGELFNYYDFDKGGNTTMGGMKVKNKKTKEKTTAYCKDWIFECYNQTQSDNRKFSKEAFYRELKKNCLREGDDLLVEKKLQIKKTRKPYLFLPSIEKAREEWYFHQEYDYQYGNDDDDDWVVDDYGFESSDEE